MVVEQLERGRTIRRTPLTGNGYHIGTMYAGPCSLWPRFPAGRCSSPARRAPHPIVKALNLKFLKPAEAELDDASIAGIGAAASEQGKAEFTLNLEPRDETATLIATSEVVYQLRRNS